MKSEKYTVEEKERYIWNLYDEFRNTEVELGSGLQAPLETRASTLQQFLKERGCEFRVNREQAAYYIVTIERLLFMEDVHSCAEYTEKFAKRDSGRRIEIGADIYKQFLDSGYYKGSREGEIMAFWHYVTRSGLPYMKPFTEEEAEAAMERWNTIQQHHRQTFHTRLRTAGIAGGIIAGTMGLRSCAQPDSELGHEAPPVQNAVAAAEEHLWQQVTRAKTDKEQQWRHKLLKDTNPDDKDLSNPGR